MNASRGTRLSGRSRDNRIRKLLLSEYREFSETILVESPFAETTRNGRGIRQVSLGLTPTRLIVAADILQTNPGFFCPSGIDVSIESFELVSVYPLEYVKLSVFRRRHRTTLKARFIDGRANYYELGGARRRVSWRIWCEQVQRLLACKTNGSSLSETTVASSSSSSTLYLLSSEIEIRNNRAARCKRSIFRVWSHYGGAGDYITPTWTDKDLYLGPSYNELMNGNYTPVPVRFAGASLQDARYELEDRTRYVACEKSCHSWPCQTRFDGRARLQRAGGLCNVLFTRSRNIHCCDYVTSCKSSPCNVCQLDNSVGINVLGKHSRCHEHRDMLFEDDFIEHVEKKYGKRQQQYRNELRSSLAKISRFGSGVSEKCNSELILGPYRGDSGYVNVVDARKLIENGVTIWEDNCRSLKDRRHPRRYGFSSAAHFFHALGPWSVQPGERESVQTFRSPSVVNIRRQPSDPELRLPVSRRQLTASISCVALTSGGSSIVGAVTRGRVILFWTPEYWYRPQAAVVAYRELRHHLASLQNFRREKEKQSKRKFFHRKNRISGKNDNSETAITRKSSSLMDRVLSINGARKRDGKTSENANIDRGTAQLRRLLRMNLRITVWDLDSTTLATQLTSIDRDLFIRIPTTEIEVLVYQRSSRNAPNLGAWIAFSHRIACLTVSEILAIKQLDMRTRIMTRFINTADKCLALGNFQSCRSILAGLQAPPIYRLRRSWSYLRTHHASRYVAMERLSKIYKSPRCSKYQRVWTIAKRNPPSMPYVGHFLIKILGLNGLNLREIQADFAPFSTKKHLTARIDRASELLSSNNNFNDFHSNSDKNLMDSKQSLARRILTATLARIKFTRQNVADEIKSDVWTCRQRYLAHRFFRHWRVVVLETKVRLENERKLKNVDSRRRRVLDIAAWLTDCQRFALGYNFPLNSFACEYLLKARYREDRENFFVSLKLEPPRI